MDVGPMDGWEPVESIDGPDEEMILDRLDLVDELTHDLRSGLIRLLVEPASVAELAERRSVPVTRLYHHINRLTDAGLIRVVATRRSGAVVERRYQVSARSYRLSDELLAATDGPTLAKVLGSLFDVAKLSFQREVESGAFGAARADGIATLALNELSTSPERRAELVDRIHALVEEFGDEGGDPYVLFVSAFPSNE